MRNRVTELTRMLLVVLGWMVLGGCQVPDSIGEAEPPDMSGPTVGRAIATGPSNARW